MLSPVQQTRLRAEPQHQTHGERMDGLQVALWWLSKQWGQFIQAVCIYSGQFIQAVCNLLSVSDSFRTSGYGCVQLSQLLPSWVFNRVPAESSSSLD